MSGIVNRPFQPDFPELFSLEQPQLSGISWREKRSTLGREERQRLEVRDDQRKETEENTGRGVRLSFYQNHRREKTKVRLEIERALEVEVDGCVCKKTEWTDCVRSRESNHSFCVMTRLLSTMIWTIIFFITLVRKHRGRWTGRADGGEICRGENCGKTNRKKLGR